MLSCTLILLQLRDSHVTLFLLMLFVCLFVRPYKGQSALDIVTSEEMKDLLSSPVKESEPVTNGSSTNLDSGIPNNYAL